VALIVALGTVVVLGVIVAELVISSEAHQDPLNRAANLAAIGAIGAVLAAGLRSYMGRGDGDDHSE